MAKAKNTAFFCKECGYESSKWLGQCPECRQWNTFVEEPVAKQTLQGNIRGIAHRDVMPSVLSGISLDEEERTLTGYSELDRVLGGGHTLYRACFAGLFCGQHRTFVFDAFLQRNLPSDGDQHQPECEIAAGEPAAFHAAAALRKPESCH